MQKEKKKKRSPPSFLKVFVMISSIEILVKIVSKKRGEHVKHVLLSRSGPFFKLDRFLAIGVYGIGETFITRFVSLGLLPMSAFQAPLVIFYNMVHGSPLPLRRISMPGTSRPMPALLIHRVVYLHHKYLRSSRKQATKLIAQGNHPLI